MKKWSWHKTALVSLLVWVAVAGLTLAWRTSMTTDEGIHTASAYLALTRGEHRFDPEHPFLFKYLTALPLLPLDLNVPQNDQELWNNAIDDRYDSWGDSRQWSDRWFYDSGNNGKLMIFLARIPGVLSLLGLCALVYYLGKKWFNPTIGLWALFFTAFNPTLLAHGSLTNTDVPLALAFLGALWALYTYYEKPSYLHASYVGLLLATTILTKFSGVAIFIVALIWLGYTVITKKIWLPALGHAATVILIILASIWLVYLGRDTFAVSFSKLAFYLPDAFVKGVLMVKDASEEGRTAYLLDFPHPRGIWQYFPILFLLKTQLIALLLLLLGIAIGLKQLVERKVSPTVILLFLATIVFGKLAIDSKLNLGIRHISPLLPIVSLALATIAYYLQQATTWRHITTLILVLYTLPVFMQFPNLIGFGNVFVHPYDKAYRFYDDSNLDWGQQTESISKVIKEHFPTEAIAANYFWSPYALPYYGVESSEFDPQNPPANTLLIVTATQLARDKTYRHYRDIKPAYVIANNTYFFYSSDL